MGTRCQFWGLQFFNVECRNSRKGRFLVRSQKIWWSTPSHRSPGWCWASAEGSKPNQRELKLQEKHSPKDPSEYLILCRTVIPSKCWHRWDLHIGVFERSGFHNVREFICFWCFLFGITPLKHFITTPHPRMAVRKEGPNTCGFPTE